MLQQSPKARRASSPSRPALMRLYGVLSAFLFVIFLTSTTYAADLSGTWTASSLRVSWSIGDWGKSCGPRPSGGGERGGTVTLTPSGAGFKLSGLNRSYATNQCWERMPGLAARSHSAGSSAIKTTCRMPAGDPRQATVITTWYPRGDEIYFDETGQYQFVSSGSNCTASVRRTRVLKRLIEKSEPEPADKDAEAPETKKEQPDKTEPKTTTTNKQAPSTAPPPPPKRASHCDKPGPPVHLEVSPKTKLMRLGESFTFQAIARDQGGCRAKISTVWTLLSGQSGTVSKNGKVTIPDGAPTGTLQLEALVGDQSVKVTARVVTEEEYEALIAGGEYGVMGDSLDAASVKLSTSHVEFESSTGTEKKGGKTTLLLIVAGLFVALVGIAFALVRRQNGPAPSDPDALQEVPAEAAPANPIVFEPETTPSAADESTAPAVAPKPIRLCPVCGQRFDDGTMFCTEDGARLVRSN